MGLSADRIIVVTGASRGVGKGVALALAPGATVYVTGRTTEPTEANPGTIADTAEEIDRRGGTGIPVVCDHGDREQVRDLFERVAQDHGRLDILVNNAAALPPKLPGKAGFWEQSLDQLDCVEVGMISHYVASYYAAPLMVANGEGLIVHTSSPAGRSYILGPAQGASKAGADKMCHDMAVELADSGVAVVSIWPGLVITERTPPPVDGESAAGENRETAEFTGLVIDGLARDRDLMAKSGKVFWGAELAEEYRITDLDGRQPASNRSWLGPTTEYGDAVLFR